MKNRIELCTLKDVNEFCASLANFDGDVYLVDSTHSFKVNAKSQIACLLAQAEWNQTYVQSDKDCYELIKKWVI